MNQVLRINTTDPLFTLAHSGAAFSLLFRGTSIKFYGILSKGGGLVLSLDGKVTTVLLNSTTNGSAAGTTPTFHAGKLEDGDHQLYGEVESREDNGLIIVDHFEIENSSGGGFDLLWAGPNATNVPKEAVIVDDASPDIIINDVSLWNLDGTNVGCHLQSLLFTNTSGASLSYPFNGVAIWYYGSLGLSASSASFTVSIDGSTPQRLDGRLTIGQVDQQVLWANTNLGPGGHNLTVTHDDVRGTILSFDFFRILRDEDASALLSITATATFPTITASGASVSVFPNEAQAVDSTNKSNAVPLAVGLTLGLLALIALVFGCLSYLPGRRRRLFPDFSAQPASLRTEPPSMTQAHQQSGWSRYRKRLPQPSRVSGVAIVPGDSAMSFGEAELGPPPSYDGHA